MQHFFVFLINSLFEWDTQLTFKRLELTGKCEASDLVVACLICSNRLEHG